MAKKIPQSYTTFSGGIADFIRSGIDNSFAFGQSVDIRSDINNITVLPRSIKESGTVVLGLPKWAETYNANLTTYLYDNGGRIYSRTSAGSYSLLRIVANSHGNGLVYSAEDDSLYYASDKVIGRYGTLGSGSPAFVDDYFGSLGGVPLNTNSLDLESGSSQYASRADTASLSITGSIAFDYQIKPESLPSVGNQMVIASKWNESGATRSYKFDINTASGYFGDGSDGSLTISSDTTEAPIDSACTATAGTTSISATNVSFAAGQIILIHQTQGTNAGQWERNTIQSYTAGTITTATALIGSYVSGAQVRVLKQYSSVTIDSGKTYSAKAWTGTVGGIIGWVCSGTTTVTGTISANGLGQGGAVYGSAGLGYAGGQGIAFGNGRTGEGTPGGQLDQRTPNGNGGGGSASSGGGGGGGNGTIGTNGASGPGTLGQGGNTSGSSDLTSMTFGGGGGSASDASGGASAGYGGNGAGIVFISSVTLTVSGGITANGYAGHDGNPARNDGGGGGGAGGSILLKVQTASLGSALITATGGSGGVGTGTGGSGGSGGVGRIHLDYYTSYTGTTSPTLDVLQDNNLVANTTTQLRLSLSSTGSNSETLAYDANIQTGQWQQVGVSWDSSSKIATFYLNAVAIGTRTGTLGAIHDNASRFAVGASYDSGGLAANFFDGLVDEGRLFNVTRSTSDMLYGLNMQIPVNTTGLVAYYKFNGDYTDATANANNLTATGAPVFSSDVPYPSPTTRLDIDQSQSGVGNTYAVPTAISEAAADRITFTPAKDPQKSIQFNVSDIGTGTWTITIHDSQNNVIATSTVTNANMHTGNYEFAYSSVWRPLSNFTNEYHAHITCASGTPTVVSTAANDLETSDFVTYFQFLVNDTEWHPMIKFLNYWVVGNERYVGKYEAPLYEPNKIVLQAGMRVRCFALWREYLAIGIQKGSNIYDFDSGRVYFWDGIAPTFNFYIDVPEGGINALLGTGDKLYIWAGYRNQLLLYGGGTGTPTKLKDMPKMEVNKYSEIYPQGVTMWQALLRYGVAGGGDTKAVQKGVYTYGSTNLRYPDILTYDYPISTGNTSGTNLKVGLLTVVQKKLLIGWQDGTAYGVDYVDVTNAPYPSSYIEFLIKDDDSVWKEKEAIEFDVVFNALRSGENVSSRYALDGSTTFTSNPDTLSTGDTISRQLISDGRYHEVQAGIDLTSGSTAPTIKGAVFISNALDTEGRTG